MSAGLRCSTCGGSAKYSAATGSTNPAPAQQPLQVFAGWRINWLAIWQHCFKRCVGHGALLLVAPHSLLLHCCVSLSLPLQPAVLLYRSQGLNLQHDCNCCLIGSCNQGVSGQTRGCPGLASCPSVAASEANNVCKPWTIRWLAPAEGAVDT